jgi:soluble P-type ATPase
MIEIAIPGHKDLHLSYLVLDYNGTLAVDGELIPGVRNALSTLAKEIELHIVTADTFGKVQSRLAGGPWQIVVLPADQQDVEKQSYVENLGPGHTAAIGNGRNDRLMLAKAALGIAVIEGEGAAAQTLLSADVVCPSILSALDLFTHPLRLVATLRS